MLVPSLFLLSSLLYIPPIIAIPGRVLQACTALEYDVFCYGGYNAASGGVFKNTLNGHFTIDLRTLDLTKPLVTPQWKRLGRTANSPPFERRSALQMAALDDHRYIMLGGGHNGPLNNSAVIYDKTTNDWTALASPPFYMAEGGMVAKGDNVWAYGGTLNSTATYTPNNLLKLDISTGTAQWSVLQIGRGGPTVGRYGHSQTMRNNIIYFFGGFLNLPERKIVTFSTLTWYNTQTDQWSHTPSNGDIPTPRKYLTSTLLPNSSQILLYGGSDTGSLQTLPLKDFCYIYDANTHKYTAINLTSNAGAGPRIGHSAIAYQNSVLILMGYDSSGNISNDSHVLDVSVPERPVWAGQRQPGGGLENDDGGDTGLGTGAIVGIAIGCVAFVAIVGATLFLCYRKRSQRQNNNDDYIPPPQDFHVDIPTMFSENNGLQKKNDMPEQNDRTNFADYSTDPVPAYPVTKPYEDDNPSPQLPRTKPSSSE